MPYYDVGVFIAAYGERAGERGERERDRARERQREKVRKRERERERCIDMYSYINIVVSNYYHNLRDSNYCYCQLLFSLLKREREREREREIRAIRGSVAPCLQAAWVLVEEAAPQCLAYAAYAPHVSRRTEPSSSMHMLL